MTQLFQDLRYALRQFRKSPGATAVALLTLALGIGATTAIFTVAYGVLLRPLPYAGPNRIMTIYEVTTKGTWNRVADPNFDDFRDQNRSFEAVAKYSAYITSVSGASQPSRSMVAHVSSQFFDVFRVQPIIGRNLTAADARKGAAPTVLVSYGYWKQYLGSSLDLSQLHLKIDNAVFSVIGVLRAWFQFPAEVAMWVPADLEGETPSRTAHNYDAVGRLRDGVTVEQARADISAIARRIHDTSSDQNEYLLKDGIVVPLRDAIATPVRQGLLILLGAGGFLLLVACANVANLRLSQTAMRERELAIRSALGARRGRLIRQFITEAFFFSVIGGVLGLLGAFFGVAGLVSQAPQTVPRLNEISINAPVLMFAFLLCSLVAVGLGAFTAMRATARDPRRGLTEGGREAASSQSSQRIGRTIAAVQIAITLVLLVGAGLLGRSLMKVLEVDPGFRIGKIVAMKVSLPWMGWYDAEAKTNQANFFRALIDRLKQIPGVREVGAASGLPMDGYLPDGMFALMKQNDAPPKTPEAIASLWREKTRVGVADFCVASGRYFQVLGIPLLRGRFFDEHDGPGSAHVALISASLARRRWPGQDPIGHVIEFGNMDGDPRVLTIVGIVGDVHEYGLDQPPRPIVYVNVFQRAPSAMTLTMLSDADTQSITAAARRIVHELNPEIPAQFQTFSEIYSASLGSRRFNLILMGFFATVALLLASAGVFGVIAYSVGRRTREIGVRVALGATSRDVLTMILVQGLHPVLIGVIFGVVGSFALTRLMQSMLYGVKATDPLTLAAVIQLMIVVALLACFLPAHRAAKVDPVVALRYE